MLLFLEQRKENVMGKITPQAGKPLLIKIHVQTGQNNDIQANSFKGTVQ
jgi:hypothetical protein